MPRNIEVSFRREIEAGNAKEVNLAFVTISHASLDDPIRVVWDVKDYVWGGLRYIGFPFDMQILSDEEGPPKAQLSIQNIDPRIGDTIRGLPTPPKVSLLLLSSADFDTNNDPRTAHAGVAFNGGGNYLQRLGGLTGAADGKQGIISFWFQPSDLSANQVIFAASPPTGSNNSRYTVLTSGAFEITGVSSSATTVLRGTSTVNPLTAGNRAHVMASWDLTSTAKRWMYINGVDAVPSWATYTNTNIDRTVADWWVGASSGGGSPVLDGGQVSDLFFAPTYVDLSVSGNRDKFYNGGSGGGPYAPEMGGDGGIPLGSSPLVYLTTPDFGDNRGTGGGFHTELGDPYQFPRIPYWFSRAILINVKVDFLTITGDLVGWDYLQRVWPGRRATQALFPGLFR